MPVVWPVPVSIERDLWDWIFGVIAAIGSVAAAAAVVVAVWTTVLSRRDATTANARAVAAEERSAKADARLAATIRQQSFERRASAAKSVFIQARWDDDFPPPHESMRAAMITVTNSSEFPITNLDIGAWDAWGASPVNAMPGEQVNPVVETMRPGAVYQGMWWVEGNASFPLHPPIVASFTDRFLQTWQLANGHHLRLVSAFRVIEDDWMPHISADSVDDAQGDTH